MFQRQILASVVIAAIGSFAQAQSAATNSNVGSEFFYQTPAGKQDITARLGYRMNVTREKATTTAPNPQDVKNTGLDDTGVSYEYGISDAFSVGADLNFSSLETDETTKVKTSGLKDPMINFKGTSGMDFGRLRYGAMLGLGGLQKAKQEADSKTAMTGGYSLTPYVGADSDVGPGILGARLSYGIAMERTIEVTGTTGSTDYKGTGGNNLGVSVFYEYVMSDMLFGGAINYNSISEITLKDTATNAEGKSESFNTTGVSLYSRIPMGFDLIPRLDYVFADSSKDKASNMLLSLAGRFSF